MKGCNGAKRRATVNALLIFISRLAVPYYAPSCFTFSALGLLVAFYSLLSQHKKCFEMFQVKP